MAKDFRGLVFLLLLCLFLGVVGCKTIPAVIVPQDPDPGDPDPGENTFYVSTTGNDANPGSLQAPWRNPGYASRQLAPGDTLVILGGTYFLSRFDDDILIPPSGEEGKWITIRGEEGNRPILAGRDNLFCAIMLTGVSYLRLQNLEITADTPSFFRDAITGVEGPNAHLEFEDLYIHHIDQFGINLKDVSYLDIRDCILEYCGFGCIGGPEGDAGGWQNVTIQDCELSFSGHYYQGQMDNPALPYDRPDGIGLEPSEGPIEIARCVAQHNRGDGLDTKNDNTWIHECLVANNYADGVKLWGDGTTVENTLIVGTGDGDANSPWSPLVIGNDRTPGARFTLTNVTIHGNPDRRSYSMYAQYDSNNPVTVELTNCIFSHCYGMAFFGDSVTLVAKNNDFYRPNHDDQVYANGREYTAAQINAGQLGEGNMSHDPLFVAPAWGSDVFDFHLTPNSPCLDQGSAQDAPDIDLEGNDRPQGEGYDIGAYEQ
ncbi:MAG TPA: right-handed parallel beta-helix repeat-containing protein [Thermotogota bacterium]|nr:right-handed parallel beta-helix repeat-containing protein [Thermotogota bacterium]HRW92536.1 right-handed parallel beta-helix repeat-containing protein [Thermotogota bacterium]